MNVEILFITNKEDISIDYLISKLELKTKKFLRINSEDINKIDFNINPNGEFVIRTKSKTFNLKNVKSVVFKRTPIKFDLNKDSNQNYLNNERKHFFEGLYLCLQKAKWINPMFATHIAERKIFQLNQANLLGLQTPDSIITNNSLTAHNFLQTHQKSIIKPISNGLQILDKDVYSIYTSDISKDFFRDYKPSDLFETPVYLQERIENKSDIRVVIISEELFAVRIDKNDKLEVDWRKPEIIKTYNNVNLPKKLCKLLIDFNKSFGLIYSAIDLIQKPNGEFIFLEINPVGEWVWLESELNLNISDKLINEMLWLN